jgi:hypothetical protein
MPEDSPEQQVWIAKARELVKAGRAKDEKLLKAVGARTETRKATAAVLEDMLVDTGRSKGDAKGSETERAKKEETFLHEVSERTEHAANTAFVSESIADVVANRNLRQVPQKANILNLFPTAAAAPAGQQRTAWENRNNEYQAAMAEYNAAQIALTAMDAKVDTAFNDLKAKNPKQIEATKAEIKQKRANLGQPALADPDLNLEVEKQTKQAIALNEVDAEIRGEIAKYDAANGAVDSETRIDAVAKIIEATGEKYGYTNLAHFISRHGAERVNPVTGAAKRTTDDNIARIATGVGPDQKLAQGAMPATIVTPDASGTDRTVPNYASVGHETTPSTSQHASAKAAMFMIEDAMAEAALVNELFGTEQGSNIDVFVGKEDVNGQQMGSYEEEGKLGRLFKLKDASAAPKLTQGTRGKPMVAGIPQRVADTEQIDDQTSAKVTLLADKMLGGYNVMTMFSQATHVAETEYKPVGGVKTSMVKTSAAVEAQRKAIMGKVRNGLKIEKDAAEADLVNAELLAKNKADEAKNAAKAVDDEIGKLPAIKQAPAKEVKDKLVAESKLAEELSASEELLKGLSADAARRKTSKGEADTAVADQKKVFDAADLALKDAVAKGVTDLDDLKLQKENAEFAATTAEMDRDELASDLEQVDKLVTAQTKKRDDLKNAAAAATKEREDAENTAALDPTAAGTLKGLLTTLGNKEKESSKENASRDAKKDVAAFYADRHADAARQYDIADKGLAEVLRLELEKELNDSKAALAFDVTKETPADYEKRLKAFEDAQRAKIEEQRKRVEQDMAARAQHGKEVRDKVRPAQAALAEQVERIRTLATEWNDKATGIQGELDKIRDKQLAVKQEFEQLTKTTPKGEAELNRLTALEQDNHDLQEQAGALTLKQNTYVKNAKNLENKAQLVAKTGPGVYAPVKAKSDEEAAKPTPRQASNVEADAVAEETDSLRLESGKANVDRAEADMELQVAEAMANTPTPSAVVKLKKEVAQTKKTFVDAKAQLAQTKVSEHELKAKYDSLLSVEAQIDDMIAKTTLTGAEPNVVDLKARVPLLKTKWEAAANEVVLADQAVKAAEPSFTKKQKELADALNP